MRFLLLFKPKTIRWLIEKITDYKSKKRIEETRSQAKKEIAKVKNNDKLLLNYVKVKTEQEKDDLKKLQEDALARLESEFETKFNTMLQDNSEASLKMHKTINAYNTAAIETNFAEKDIYNIVSQIQSTNEYMIEKTRELLTELIRGKSQTEELISNLFKSLSERRKKANKKIKEADKEIPGGVGQNILQQITFTRK